MELYLVRHGQSLNNSVDGSTKRVCDPPLTETGQAQAVRVAAALAQRTEGPEASSVSQTGQNCFGYDITMLFCSPMTRALQTAEPIAKSLALKPTVWPDVHEQYGIWLDHDDGRGPVGLPGLSRSEIAERFPDYDMPDEIDEDGWWNRPVETESQWRARAVRVAGALRTRYADTEERIAIVGHGGFTNELMHELLGRAVLPGTYFSHQNTGVTRIDFEEDERVRVRYMNRVTHLSAELIT